MDIQEIFAARIKRERIKKEKTMAEFSEELGISLSSLEEYEKGRRIPRVDTLALIAERLEIPLAELFMGERPGDASAAAYLDRLSLEVNCLDGSARRIGEEALKILRSAFNLQAAGQAALREEEGRYCYTLLTLQEPGCRRQSTYGMMAKEYCDGQWVNVASVAPFCGDRGKVLEIAEKCSALQLSPIHILDVVMDFLREEYDRQCLLGEME